MNEPPSDLPSESDQRPHVRVIGVSDLDRPLYRIFPLWFFEDALRVNGGRLLLVPPHVWEDPLEDICSRFQMEAPNGFQKPLSEYLQPIYAQCWSQEGDSDALMRAYSRVTKDPTTQRNTEPRFEGVKVKTTARKLIRAVNTWLIKRENNPWQFYLAKITYRDDFAQMFADGLAKIGPVEMGSGDNRVQSILFKRRAFEHEAEVRLICLANKNTNWPNIGADIDPNYVFEEVQFDPRLAPFERMERERMVRSLRYTGPITTSERYQKVIHLVRLPRPWDDLNAGPSDS